MNLENSPLFGRPFIMALHLLFMFSLVVEKPIFDVFSAQPDYFVINHLSSLEIYLLTAILGVFIPLAIIVFIVLLGLINKRLQLVGQLALAALLLAAFMLQIGKKAPPVPLWISVTIIVLLCGGAVVLYSRSRELSQILVILSPVALIIPLLFIYSSGVQRVISLELHEQVDGLGVVSIDETPPIIVLVFDEFALVELLDSRGAIDEILFPNFAALVSEATWYENATTVEAITTRSLPAILTGTIGELGALPTIHDYPVNLFTLLQPYYRLNMVEPITRFSPRESEGESSAIEYSLPRVRSFFLDAFYVYLHMVTPDKFAMHLPAVDDQWGGFGALQTDDEYSTIPVSQENSFPDDAELDHDVREFLGNRPEIIRTEFRSDRKASFERFVSSIRLYPTSTLHFMHILLPHTPLIYLPSGERYTDSTSHGIRGIVTDEAKAWGGEEAAVVLFHQRHRLQIGFVDTLLGRLIEELKELDIYDECILIVTSDHGKSYQMGISSRRPDSDERNFAELAFVPLIIKYPGQNVGVTNTWNVKTIDIVPTIMEVLKAKGTFEFHGESLIRSELSNRLTKKLRIGGRHVELTEDEYLRSKIESISRNTARFSLDDPRSDFYNFGPGLEFVGQPFSNLEELRVECSIEVLELEALRKSFGNRTLSIVPSRMRGKITGLPDEDVSRQFLLLVINDIVVVAKQPYRDDGEVIFDFFAPEEIFALVNPTIEFALISSG